ncbi:hypothetical protein EJ08DRAFT_70834 [Tothia fuscella]|uniref:Uncharacterized protein n=1 Tax=Tothia fuscella TaxID=1048955 RepID=A0A9P4TSX1_9PEZI|nr:hypothetical protein EJ08DRAFT_70834 [Tothia fuscella]
MASAALRSCALMSPVMTMGPESNGDRVHHNTWSSKPWDPSYSNLRSLRFLSRLRKKAGHIPSCENSTFRKHSSDRDATCRWRNFDSIWDSTFMFDMLKFFRGGILHPAQRSVRKKDGRERTCTHRM